MDSCEEEIWLPIPSESGYEASNLGRIRSIDRAIVYSSGRTRVHPGQILKPRKYPESGYLYVRPNQNTRKVHRLVAEAFHGPCPEDKITCHKDGSRDNNREDNLYYGTQKDNMADRVRHGTAAIGSNHPRAKINEEDVRKIRTLAKNGLPYPEIAKGFAIGTAMVSHIVNRRSWSHI